MPHGVSGRGAGSGNRWPLSEGHIIGEDIECPWHRSCFSIKTGRVTSDSAMEDVATYKVRLAGDAVEVEV